MLSPKQLQNVCLLNQGTKQCRYLEGDYLANSFVCRKKTPDRVKIDLEIKEDKDNLMGYPTGDNCRGYLCFKHILQGYDV